MNIPKQLQPLSKIIAVLLIVLLNGVGLMQVGSTVGFYLDVEASDGNAFIAGNVDFLATSTEWNPLTVAVNMEPGDTTTFDIDIDPLTSNPFQYYLDSTTTGDAAFCSGVSVDLEQDASTLYSGPLDTLTTGTTTSTSTLSLSATTGAGNFQNSVCSVSIDAQGWQTRHGYPTVGGFNDVETIEKDVASWGFRLNKVYYDVAPDRYVASTTTEGPNEWVEIYNQTDIPLDLSGWGICDNTSCDTIASSTPLIPAMGYAVIVNNPGTFSATGTAPWYLPAGVVKIALNDNIGNGLNNDADMLQLKRPDGVVIDQMNWGAPNTGWANYNADVWNPGAVDVAEGNLLARVPSGFDTNQPSDWVELAPPVVDLLYPDEAGSYTWYWGYSYTITWTATNPNGDDNDLNISLFYIKDIDHSATINGPDITKTIINTTANDGAYTWTVPSGFLGYIWIKLVATGPENPLNNSSTVSGLIWDPNPIFIGPEGVDPETADTEAPVITLFGNNPAVVAQDSTYVDLGASVTDNVHNNLGYTTEGEVDTDVIGEYTITYTAVDQAGNEGTASRTVIVYDPIVGSPTFETESTPEPTPESQPIFGVSSLSVLTGEPEEDSHEETLEEDEEIIEEDDSGETEVSSDVEEEISVEEGEEEITDEITEEEADEGVVDEEEETVVEGETLSEEPEESLNEEEIQTEEETVTVEGEETIEEGLVEEGTEGEEEDETQTPTPEEEPAIEEDQPAFREDDEPVETVVEEIEAVEEIPEPETEVQSEEEVVIEDEAPAVVEENDEENA